MGRFSRALTVTVVAHRLGVSTRTVQRLIADGRLRGWRPGLRAYRVWESDLRAYMQAQEVVPASAADR